MNPNWRGIMKVLEFQHFDRHGNLIYEEKNIYNTLHRSGEQFILATLFTGVAIPANYYIGLDNRTTIAVTDTLATVVTSEPTENGYEREPVASDEFNIVTNSNNNYQANSPIVTFRAEGGSWGPVKNIWLTTSSSGSSGYLICSGRLAGTTTVNDGELVSLRLGMALKDCPT